MSGGGVAAMTQRGFLLDGASPDGTANFAAAMAITVKPCACAHRFAAAGLDRDTHGREFRIGAVNDAIGSSSW